MAEKQGSTSGNGDTELAHINAQALHRNIPSAMIVAAVNLVIVTAFFWGEVPLSTLLTWSSGLLALSAIRAIISRRWLAKPTNPAVGLTVALTGLSGIAWGLPLFMLPADAGAVLSYLVIFMIAGMSAGAAISFASHLNVVLAFNAPLLVMTAGRFVEMGGTTNLIFAAVILLYLASTTLLAVRNKAVVETAHRNQLRAEAQAVEIQSMADDLKRALVDAEAATLAKSRFLSNMSHEIRTPLNGVLGMVQLLERTGLSDDQKTFTRTIASSGQALLGVIEDVLDISRIEAGAVSLNTIPFDIEKLASSCLDTVAGHASQKGLALSLDMEPDGETNRLGDAQRVRQVLINLLGNAVKFTEDGTVSLRIRTLDQGRVRFEVQDTGPGLTEDQMRIVFERFAQVDETSQRKHGGSGLGLAISNDLVGLMSGEIGVRSEAGEGSCFWFELPLPEAGPVADTPAKTAPATGEATVTDEIAPLRVLVVDDIKTNQLVAKAMLEQAGHSVTLADNGAEAIVRLEDTDFDLVIMDIQMPVMAGDEAIERIRNSPKPYSRTPIIAVTANATRGEGERLLRLGATAHATKPIDIEHIHAQIRQLDRPKSA